MTRRDNRRFQPGYGFGTGGGVYTCHICKKRTRETGEGESQLELCAACFNKASQENSHTDNHTGAMRDCAECQSAAKAFRFTIDYPCWADSDPAQPEAPAPAGAEATS